MSVVTAYFSLDPTAAGPEEKICDSGQLLPTHLPLLIVKPPAVQCRIFWTIFTIYLFFIYLLKANIQPRQLHRVTSGLTNLKLLCLRLRHRPVYPFTRWMQRMTTSICRSLFPFGAYDVQKFVLFFK